MELKSILQEHLSEEEAYKLLQLIPIMNIGLY